MPSTMWHSWGAGKGNAFAFPSRMGYEYCSDDIDAVKDRLVSAFAVSWFIARNIYLVFVPFSDSCVHVSHFSRAWLFATLWAIAHQAPPSMGFSRQEYGSGLSCSPPGDPPDSGTEPESLASPALARAFFTQALPGKPRAPKILGFSKWWEWLRCILLC